MDEPTSRRKMLVASAIAAFASLQSAAALATSGQSIDEKADPDDAQSRETLKNLLQSVDVQLKKLNDVAAEQAAARNQEISFPPVEFYARDAAEWDLVLQRAKQSYDVSAQDRSLLAPKTIDAEFSFRSFPEDNSFRFQQVEMLLDQSADLLERALSQRFQWDDLAAKAFNVAAELKEYFALDAIHDEEAKAGFYTHDAVEAKKLRLSEVLGRDGQEAQVRLLDQIAAFFYTDANIYSQSGSSQVLALLSHLANYDKEAEGTKRTKHTWNGVTLGSAEHAKDAAANNSYNALNLQAALVQLQRLNESTNALTAGAKADSYGARHAWEEVNTGFRKRRTEVARSIADQKAIAYSTPEGPLNYRDQMTRIKARYDRDFRDAIARLPACESGMKMIYGYNEPLPASVTKLLKAGTASPTVFDEALIWVRNSIAYLVKFGQLDQRYSVTVSLKSILGKDGFRKGANVRPWAEWNFEVGDDFFIDQHFVRLRGASVYVIPKGSVIKHVEERHSHGVWTAAIRVPVTSEMTHQFVSGQHEPTKVKLDQSQIPYCIVGRVAARETMRAPEVVGGVTLFNASPYGTWNLRLSPKSSEGVGMEELSDVIVELQVAARIALRQPSFNHFLPQSAIGSSTAN